MSITIEKSSKIKYIVTDNNNFLSFVDGSLCLSTCEEDAIVIIGFENAFCKWIYAKNNYFGDFRILNSVTKKDFTPPLTDVRTDTSFEY